MHPTTLAFLDQRAVTLTTADAVVQRIADLLPLRGCLPGRQDTDLFMRSVVVQLGELSMAGSAHSPLRIEMAPPPDVIPLAFSEQGSAELAADGQSVRLAPRNTALVLPSCAFHGDSEPIVSVLIHESASQLAATAAALAGPSGAAARPYRLRRPTLIDRSEDTRRAGGIRCRHRTAPRVPSPLRFRRQLPAPVRGSALAAEARGAPGSGLKEAASRLSRPAAAGAAGSGPRRW